MRETPVILRGGPQEYLRLRVVTAGDRFEVRVPGPDGRDLNHTWVDSLVREHGPSGRSRVFAYTGALPADYVFEVGRQGPPDPIKENSCQQPS